MRWLILIAGIGVSLVLSLLLSVFTHTFVFLLFLPLLFVPLLMGSNRSRR